MKRLITLIFVTAFLLTNAFSQTSNPLDLANVNIIMWLTPDSGLYNGLGFPAANGDDIFEWHDISVNGYVFNNSVNLRKPNLVEEGGHNYLDFTPGDFLQNINIKNDLNGLDEFSIFMVVKSDVTNTDNGFMDSENPDGKDDNICLRYDKNGANSGRVNCLKTGMVGNSSSHQIETQSNTQTTDRQVLSMTWKKGERLYLYVNGVPSDSSNKVFNNVLSSVQKILIGKGPKDGSLDSSTGWDGKIGTIIFYNHKYSSDTVAAISQTLPVSLVDYSVNIENESVVLEWTTATEVNNDYFTIERSVDGVNFKELKVVDGTGNTNSLTDYSYIDNTPSSGTSYYRLVQTDFDGKKEYFTPLSVHFSSKENPMINLLSKTSSDQIEFNISGLKFAQKINIIVTNLQGQLVVNECFYVEENNAQIAVSGRFDTGTYIVSCIGNNWKTSEKIFRP